MIAISQENNKITLVQAYIVLMMAIGILNHVIIIPMLLTAAKRDAWVSVLAAVAIAPLWIGCLSFIIKDMNGQAFRDWLYKHFGKTLATIILLFSSAYLFMMGSLSLKDTITWTIASYLPQTPVVAIVLVTVISCVFAANAGIRPIAIVAGILLPIVMMLGYFVMSANFKYKNYSSLFPVMEYGMSPVWKGITYAASGILELMGILFFQDHLSKLPRFSNLMVFCLILAGLILGPLMGTIAIFGPEEAAEQRYPAYEQWRMVQLGQYLAHLDFFSIYQWLSGTFIRVALALFLMVDIWKPKTKWIWLTLAGMAMMATVLLPVSDAQFFIFLKNLYLPVTVCIAVGMTVVFVTKIWFASLIKR
ncbi:GerAB/ArcD/ProY family transporter [Cohnella thermotolerans]|uniref:GerAB/ArcD/ProY family transporter n=1 Tax=Cohnella thermotolerans TaxID=329858 RepID=UPI0003FD78E3|nr:endospore germination permease [Cohnella thermotolerans]